jgi:hypothetical protein
VSGESFFSSAACSRRAIARNEHPLTERRIGFNVRFDVSLCAAIYRRPWPVTSLEPAPKCRDYFGIVVNQLPHKHGEHPIKGFCTVCGYQLKGWRPIHGRKGRRKFTALEYLRCYSNALSRVIMRVLKSHSKPPVVLCCWVTVSGFLALCAVFFSVASAQEPRSRNRWW